MRGDKHAAASTIYNVEMLSVRSRACRLPAADRRNPVFGAQKLTFTPRYGSGGDVIAAPRSGGTDPSPTTFLPHRK
jgi:hypothetical protein